MEVWGSTEHWNCHRISAPLPAEEVPKGSSYFQKFWQWRGSYHDAYRALASEPGLRRITDEMGDDIDGQWSPDGSMITWVTDRLGNWTVWVMNSHGSEKTQLTEETYVSGWPQWSPTGDNILFWSNKGGQSDLWLTDPDGTDKAKFTDDEALEGVFEWSHDGSMVAYDSNITGNWEIWTRSAQGSDPQRVTSSDGDCYLTAWSPDSKKLSYWCILESGCDSWIINRDGSEETRMTSSSFCEILPKYSPNMGQIAYLSIVGGEHYELWMMNEDGSDRYRLSQATVGDRGHVFDPQSGRLLYWGFVEHNYEPPSGEPTTVVAIPTGDIFMITDNEEYLLTFNEANDMNPSWNPAGETVLFESDRYGDFDLFTIPTDPPNVDVRVSEVDFPGDVYAGEEMQLFVRINYTLPEETFIMVAVRDMVTSEILSSEQLRRLGHGMEDVNVALSAPQDLGQWKLRAEAYYLHTSMWVHSSQDWYRKVTVSVVPEFAAIAGMLAMLVAVGLIYAMTSRRPLVVQRETEKGF
jgi:TolB protein